ncbi:metallophosphoesterase family protein [Paenibacillus xerothermodurans]|uniref:Serine/threonine protein phosphatase n=1 Tax=Paenibacillus xerothermodurans TaxID=1977292 RepID=A0A2W1NMT8_PAEXE|nr:metallophosphoesterase family protein [Paenibacillus xerothermodurans]PZE20283.1 serine/threonine protein phosphatase [Paenibacillus xerothermodurans]
MRLLFITDIHGHYDGMLQLFDSAQFEPAQDLLVVGGDMIDRGPDSGKVLKGYKLLQQMYPDNIKVLIGNHEQMMLDFYWKDDPMWKTYGGDESQASFEQVFANGALEDYLLWVDRLPMVYETEKYIFTHAGINPDFTLNEQTRDVLWMNRKEFSETVNVDALQRLTQGRIIAHGHTPGTAVKFDGLRLNCDLGSGVFPSRFAALALVDLTNDKYYRYSFQHNSVRLHDITWNVSSE